MNAWSYYWTWWFFLSAGAFLVPELWALATDHTNTLSDNVWRLEGFLPGQDVMHWTPIHVAFTVVLIAFTIWLIGHLCFRAWA